MNQIFAMDTAFRTSLGWYPLEVRCEMLRDLGYDATYLTVGKPQAWDEVPALAGVMGRYGLGVTAVYANLFITDDPASPSDHNKRVLDLCSSLEGCRQLDLCLRVEGVTHRRSDPSLDEQAIGWLERLLERGRERGIRLSLYPHVNAWLERCSDAVRLCSAMATPSVGITFPAFHVYALDDDVTQALTATAPYLTSMNVCGCRRALSDPGGLPTILPMDEGELDIFALLSVVRSIGFTGPIGIQGYSVGGDVYDRLRRSLRALKDAFGRLEAHPGWGALQPVPATDA